MLDFKDLLTAPKELACPYCLELANAFNFDNFILENKEKNSLCVYKNYNKKNSFILFINKPKFDKFRKNHFFIHTEGIYKGIFRRKDDEWYTFNSGKDSLPP